MDVLVVSYELFACNARSFIWGSTHGQFKIKYLQRFATSYSMTFLLCYAETGLTVNTRKLLSVLALVLKLSVSKINTP